MLIFTRDKDIGLYEHLEAGNNGYDRAFCHAIYEAYDILEKFRKALKEPKSIEAGILISFYNEYKEGFRTPKGAGTPSFKATLDELKKYERENPVVLPIRESLEGVLAQMELAAKNPPK